MTVRLFALLLLLACGGTDSGRTTPGSTASSTATRERPSSDQGLSTVARNDPPPFPASDLIHLIQPVGEPLARERLVAIAMFIRWYERDPFDPRIGMDLRLSVRSTLLAWLIESPDVSVVVTPTVSSNAEGRGQPLTEAQASYLTVGGMLGMAADAIEHPERDERSPERQAAGIESGLRWYQAAVARGGARNPVVEEFVQIAAQGRLAEWFGEHITIH